MRQREVSGCQQEGLHCGLRSVRECHIALEMIVEMVRSTNLVKIAKQHEPHSSVVADNLSLPHPSGTFDFAISIAVIHHLSTSARRIEAVKCVLDILKRPSHPDFHDGGRTLIYVWALEQKDSRRGWDEGHEQDVMVPWVLKQKKEKKPKRSQKEGDVPPQEGDGDKTYLRYYHLYKKGELEQDIEQAGGIVLESGYEKDNWWAIAVLEQAYPASRLGGKESED